MTDADIDWAWRCPDCGDEYTEFYPSANCDSCGTALVDPSGRPRSATSTDVAEELETTRREARDDRFESMIVVTTSEIGGQEVDRHLGLVAGTTIEGANFLADAAAKVRDVVGGRVSGYERRLDDARDSAVEHMKWRAAARGADACVGVRVGHEAIGSMLMVTAVGTAVTLRPRP